MILDFIDNINGFGDNIVRLSNFTHQEATSFKSLMTESIIIENNAFELKDVEFIESKDCSLTFRIGLEDEGISTSDKKSFFCDMTVAGYRNMIALIEPYCKRDRKSYTMLYDVDSNTDLLFTPSGE